MVVVVIFGAMAVIFVEAIVILVEAVVIFLFCYPFSVPSVHFYCQFFLEEEVL